MVVFKLIQAMDIFPDRSLRSSSGFIWLLGSSNLHFLESWKASWDIRDVGQWMDTGVCVGVCSCGLTQEAMGLGARLHSSCLHFSLLKKSDHTQSVRLQDHQGSDVKQSSGPCADSVLITPECALPSLSLNNIVRCFQNRTDDLMSVFRCERPAWLYTPL